MYQQHLSRRRKKRPINGIKTVQVTRGRSGYGFTISGQNPCILSCIVGGSPADLAGLKAGDYLYVVNGINVSRAPHDEVVRMVGQSTGTLELQVAENYNSSDSSEDDYSPRTKTRYPNRARLRQKQASRQQPAGTMASRPLPQRPVDGKVTHARQPTHVPVGAESNFPTSVPSPLSSGSDEKSAKDFYEQAYGGHCHTHYESIKVGRPDGRGRNVKTHSRHAENNSTTDVSGDGFAFTTVQNGPIVSTAKISSGISKRPSSKMQEPIARSVSCPISKEGILAHNHIAGVNQEAGYNEDDQNADESETEKEEGIPPVEHGTRAIVGYIGSIELPGNATRPNQRLQLLRSAVRRLRIEQKIHTLVLMEVNQEGVRLTGNAGATIAYYSVEKLAFSGVCPDDKRFFGIVTLHSVSDDVSEFSGAPEERSPSSSCHIFMVDPDICPHLLHCHKAKAFNLHCTPSPSAQRCLEFPQSPTHLILCIANLYRDRPRTKLDSEIIQSHALADPSRPAARSNSNSSNSDSGLGFGREDVAADQVCVVDMPSGGNPRPVGSAFQPCRKGQPQLQPLLPVMPTSTSRGMLRPLSAFEIRRGLNNSSSSEECWAGHGQADKLTPRAMPDPASMGLLRATSADRLEHGHSAENLRQSIQRLLQARHQRLEQDQALSSDSESQTSSRMNSNLLSSHSQSAFQVPRPVSAPIQPRGRLQKAPEAVETVDMGMGKLSPRAFKQPASMIRSPSAPPIPYFPHQDSDDEDDDTESEDDPFVRKIISQFNRDRLLDLGKENPRRYSEGLGLGQRRDKPWVEAEELQNWTKTGSFRRSQNMKMALHTSHSHESLVVGDLDASQSQKLISANSVSSILQPSSPLVEDEVRCVAGWAVGFQRLLSDPDGLRIFKEFLKKEYSEENIDFWNAVESYRNITDYELRRARALEIYSKHLDHTATHPVNVDSSARLFAEKFLSSPTSSMFDMAQQQIFHLMRQDSYVRFLKSDLYKGLLMHEMEGRTLPLAVTGMPPPSGCDVKKKGKGKENEEKRRRSLLPWRQNKKSNKKTSSSDCEPKRTGKGGDKKEKEDQKEEVNNNVKKAPGPGIDLSTMRKEVFNPRESENTEQFKFCRVVMPDGSTTVVCTRPGQNIRTVLGKLCEKRALSIAAVDVFLLGSDKPLDLGEDISTLGSKEVVIERRVLFRLDLPIHKSIGVKAKPNRSIRDVFKPILNKYGYRIDNVGVQLSGMPEFLDVDIPVSDIDNQRVIIIARVGGENTESCAEGGQSPTNASVPAHHHRRTPFLLPSRVRGGKGGSLEEITNKIFDDLMKGKSELAHTFDDLGVVDLERSKGHKSTEDHRSLGLFGRLKKDTWGPKDRTKQKNKGRVTFSLPRSDARKNKKMAEDEHLMELIANTQCQQLEAECHESEDNATSEFLCTDAVEHVDLDPFSSWFDFHPVSIFSGDPDGSLLPPPDMFDDVQYMHSCADRTLVDFDKDEEFVDSAAVSVAGGESRQVRSYLSTFMPTAKPAKLDQNSAQDKNNPYLSMHPVVVDTKFGEDERDEKPQTGSCRSLHTIFETLSSQSSGANSIHAVNTEAHGQDQVLPASPQKSGQKGSSEMQRPSQKDPEKQQRPIPARRRLLDQNSSSSSLVLSTSQPQTAKAVQEQDQTTRDGLSWNSQRISSPPTDVNLRLRPTSSSSIPVSRPLQPPAYTTAIERKEALSRSYTPQSGASTPLSRSHPTSFVGIGRPQSQASSSLSNFSPHTHAAPSCSNTEREGVKDHKAYPLGARDSPKSEIVSKDMLRSSSDSTCGNDRLHKYTSFDSHPRVMASNMLEASKQQSVIKMDEFVQEGIPEESMWRRSQIPDVIASRRSRTPDVISPHRQVTVSSSGKEVEARNKSMLVVAAEVHQQCEQEGVQKPDLQLDSLSYDFDSASFSDLTVTFV